MQEHVDETLLVRGVDFPAEHRFKVSGESLVAKFDGETWRAGGLGSWTVYRIRAGGRLEKKGLVEVPSFAFDSSEGVRAFVRVEFYRHDIDPYDYT